MEKRGRKRRSRGKEERLRTEMDLSQEHTPPSLHARQPPLRASAEPEPSASLNLTDFLSLFSPSRPVQPAQLCLCNFSPNKQKKNNVFPGDEATRSRRFNLEGGICPGACLFCAQSCLLNISNRPSSRNVGGRGARPRLLILDQRNPGGSGSGGPLGSPGS